MKQQQKRYLSKPETDIVRENIQRRCLNCEKVFTTNDIGIRMCTPCKKLNK